MVEGRAVKDGGMETGQMWIVGEEADHSCEAGAWRGNLAGARVKRRVLFAE